jgi:oligogalacturonide lyase
VRLTSPAFASGLPAPQLKMFTRRADALIYWSERDGSRQLYRLDLKNGESKQLTETASLDVSAFSLSPDDKYIFFFDGQALQSLSNGASRPREVHRASGAIGGFTVAADGSVLFADGPRIMRVALQKTGPVVTAEGDAKIDLLTARPRHAQVLYRQGGAYWMVNTDGGGKKPVSFSKQGRAGEVFWSPTGKTLLYLSIPEDPKALISLREYSPDDSTDRLIARTSQYGAFAPNGDASVFAGASRSKASSYILILLRVTKRELTLCEHHASDPSVVSVVFAPDSQSIVFTSDRHGKAALYRVPVEKFVEETGDQ